MQLDSTLTLDQILDLETTLERRKQELAAQQEPTDRAKFVKLFALHGWTADTFASLFDVAEVSPSTKGSRTIAAQYFDDVARKGWTGHGSGPSEAMKAAREFDKANPNAIPKRLDQFKIPDHTAKEIAVILKKNVKTISGNVINYADLVADAANQPVEKMAV